MFIHGTKPIASGLRSCGANILFILYAPAKKKCSQVLTINY